MRRLRTVLPLLLFVGAPTVLAAGLPETPLGPLPIAQVPEPLKPWIGWSLRGHEELLCPRAQGGDDETRLCVWPSRMALELDAHGGKFSQSVRLYRDALVPLPGNKAAWPQDVRADGKSAAQVPVLADGDTPSVWLAAGEHVLSGDFSWKQLPESIHVPPSTGLVALTLRGKSVPFPSRDLDGLIWLQREQEDETGESRLDIQVWRQVIDEVPLRVVTRVQLQVSGKNREVLLGRGLLEGFIPLSLDSELPARLEPDGRIRVQVRPGTFRVELTARHPGLIDALSLPKEQLGPWSPEELWSFAARPDLRVVEIVGVPSIDPAQTTMPDEWRALPAYPMRPGDTMTLKEERRGDAEPAPDQLSLSRLLWLDFDGKGLTAKDSLSGTLTRSDRLEMPEPAELGRVTAAGKDQLITRLSAGSAPGVELRQGNLSLEAESRSELRAGSLEAVGWSHGVRWLGAQLVLPPGWRLLHASGADEISPTWIQGWSLLDLFLLLLATLAAGKLFGWPIGAAMFVALGLSIPEGAPKWAWLLPLAAEALLRAVPKWRLQFILKIARGAALVALLLMIAPFAISHLRSNLYPGLEHEPGFNDFGIGALAQKEPALEARLATVANFAPPQFKMLSGAAQAPRAPDGLGAKMNDVLGGVRGGAGAGGTAMGIGGMGTAGDAHRAGVGADLGGRGKDQSEFRPEATRIVNLPADGERERAKAPKQGYQQQLDLSRIDPNALAQTGPGTPEWSWNTVELRWSGPVEAGARVRLWLLSPWMNLLLAFLRVGLLAFIWLKLLAPGVDGRGGLRALLERLPKRAAVAAVLAFALLAPSARAGDFPSNEMLDELRTRLLAPDGCDANCLSSPRLVVEANGPTLRLRVQLDAMSQMSAPLPGALGHWSPQSVLIDGKPADSLERGADGTLWIVVTPGSHQVVLEGTLPARDEVQLTLPLLPKHVEASLNGWTLDGLHDDGTSEENLQLVRVVRGEAKSERLEPGQLPPFVEVERALLLGMTWQVSTRVQRLSPGGAPITLEVPLLPGESITSPDVHAENGKAQVTFGPRTDSVSWTSTLAEVSKLKLTALNDPALTESWRLEIAPTWHVTTVGVPPIHQETQAQRVPAYRPWPGESLELTVTRPAPVAGATLTLQSSTLAVRPGARTSDVQLAVKLSASRGGPTSFTLPEGAELQALSFDGASLPVRQEGRKVTLAIAPGDHRAQLDWREPRGMTSLYKTPRPDLALPSVNATLQLTLPSRWVLFTGGPRLGPAVLIWSFVVIMLLCAFGLSHIGTAPLRTHQWGLLALGLTQVDIVAAAFVAAWFLILAWRRTAAPRIPGVRRFDLLQLALIVWTLVAGSILVAAIQRGLLGEPEMQVAGNGSTATLLNWFTDRTGPELPGAWVLSLPIFVYRLAMLAWALWLALSMVRWLPWAWECFSAGGILRPILNEKKETAIVHAEAAPATTAGPP